MQEVVTIRKSGVRTQEERSAILGDCETVGRSRDPGYLDIPLVEPAIVFEKSHEHASQKPMNCSLGDRIVRKGGVTFGGPFGSSGLDSSSVTLAQPRFKCRFIGQPLPNCS